MHPDGRHLVYSLGGTIVVRDLSRPQHQSFLQGHTNNVSCLACSSSGSYLASGQSTHTGFKVHLRALRACVRACVPVVTAGPRPCWCAVVLAG